MTPQRRVITYIVMAIGASLLLAAVAETWSGYRVRKLERAVTEAQAIATEIERRASTAETEAAQYRAKIEHLERVTAEIAQIARKQDEELEKLSDKRVADSSDVDRARGVRAIDATTDELCKKLAELGHGCE